MGMGGGMKPGMGGKPGDSDCQQQLMQMICSGKDEMGGKPGGNASKPMEGMEAMLEDMCSNGGKPEIMKELMVMMNITEEMIKEFMMSLPDEKKEMLQNIIQMIESGNKPMGGVMKPPMGTGGNKPMGGGMKPMGGGMKPMGGGMKPPMGTGGMGMGGGMKPGMGGKPGDSDCQQQLMEMICSGKDGMGGKPGGKPGSMQDIKAGVMQMMMEMTGLTMTDQGEAALDVNCDCMPMKQK